MGNSLGGFDTLFMPVGRTDAQAAMRMSKSRSEYRSINNTVIANCLNAVERVKGKNYWNKAK